MATNWGDEANNSGSASNYAPAGLRQSKQPTDWSQEAGTSERPWLRPAWQTGGQVGSTRNAFTDDFYTRMYDQYDEEQQRIQKDPNYVSNLFVRDDFTGIVGWDQTIKPGGEIKVDRVRRFEVGDIYDNGEFKGNVYKDKSLSLEEANAMVAPHIFGDRAADKYKDANGDQQKLKDMILKQAKEEGQRVEAYTTRMPYQRDVNNLLEEWDKGIYDEVAATFTGALGGAVAGIVAGPWGIVGGAILGGVGGFMNKDESNRMAAQALVSTGLVGEQAGWNVAVAHGASQWSNLALGRLNVFSNLLSGGIDTLSGKWDDEESEAQRASAAGNVGVTVAQGVTGFVDGMLTAASGVGAITYASLAEGSAVSAAAAKAMGDGEWDEVTGTFHRYEGMEQRLAAAGASAIDVAQGMLPAFLRNSAAKGIGGTGSIFARSSGDTVAKSSRSVMVMDQSYKLDDLGRAVGVDKAQAVLGWFAPSSIVNKLSVRSSALMESARTGGGRINADDLYRAALRLEQANVPWKLAMVNGFGEASEEVAQTFLNAQAVGWDADPQEYLHAAIAGFSMGAGMSVGARLGSVSQDRRQLFRANVLARADGRPEMTLAEFRAKDQAERERLSTPTRSAARQIRIQNEQNINQWEEMLVESTVGLAERSDALKAATKASSKISNSESLEDMADIIPFESVSIPSHYIMHSAKTTVEKFESRLAALQEEVARRDPSDPQTQHITKVAASLENLLSTVLRPGLDLWNRSGQSDVSVLNKINQTLEDWWNGKKYQRRAVELIFSRSPNDNAGSFQMLLPQIDGQLTIDNIHGMSKVSQSLEKVLSHDNDGDKIKHQARYIPDDANREVFRLGANLWANAGGNSGVTVTNADGTTSLVSDTAAPLGGGGFLNIAHRVYEDATLRLMSFDLVDSDVSKRVRAHQHFDNLVAKLKDELGSAVPRKVWAAFRSNLTKDPEGAKTLLYRDLANYSGRLLKLGRDGNKKSIPAETNIGLWIEDKIQIALNDWREESAELIRVEVAPPAQRAADTPPLSPDTQTTRGTPAATRGQTLNMRTGGSSNFRNVGQIAYGTINSSSIDAEGVVDADSLVQGLTEWYTVLSRLRPLTQVDTILQGGNPVLREAQTDLENIARIAFADEWNNGGNRDELLFRVATAPFWGLTEKGLQTNVTGFVKPESTVAQVLLKNAAEKQSALVPTPPGELDITAAYTNMTPGAATMQLVGGIPLERLVGPEAARQLGPFNTLRGLASDYTARAGRQRRRDWIRQMRAYGEYGENRDKPFAYGSDPSTYRLIVDTVRQAVDTELAHDPSGTGHANGRLAGQDREFHKLTVLNTMSGLRSITRELGIDKDTPIQSMIELVEKNTQAVQYMLRLFTAEQRLRIIGRPDGNGAPNQVVLPRWFFELMREDNPERAAMLYFNANFDLEWEAWDKTSPSGNSWVELYVSLSPSDRNAFNDLRAISTNVQEFVDQVNKQWADTRLPMLAWRTDSTLYDPSSTRGGWQWSNPSSERRIAMQDAQRYLNSKASTIVDDLALTKRNLSFATKLQRELTSPKLNVRSAAQKRVNMLTERLAQAQRLSNAAMGPAGIREIVMMAREGLDIASAQKGKPGPSSAQFGDLQAKQDATSFDSQFGQALDSVTAINAANLSTNPQMLARPLRISTETGAIINWNPLSGESFLDLFTADDGAYQGLLFDILSPMIYEENGFGKLSYQHLLPKDLEAVVTSSLHEELLSGVGSRNSQENDELLISYINSLTPDNNVVRLMMKIAVARTTGSVDAQEMGSGQYQLIVRDVAAALRSLSGMSKESAEEAQQAMRVQAILDYMNNNELSDDGLAFKTGTIDALIKARKAELDAARAVYNSSKDIADAVTFLQKQQEYIQSLAIKETKSVSDVMLSALKIHWNTPEEVVVRSAIEQYIRVYGPALRTTLTGDDLEAVIRFDQAGRANDGLKTFGPKNQETWEQLAKVVAFHNALRNSENAAATFVPTPAVDDMQYFDPTFSYIGEYLVSEPIHSAATAFRALVPGSLVEVPTPDGFIRDLRKGVLNKRYLGTWTVDLVTQHLGADRAMDASGSAQQVAIGGLTPQVFLGASNSAVRTFDVPPIEKARPISFDPQTLVKSSNDFSPGLNGEPWLILEGAAVVTDSLRYVVRDADGNELGSYPMGNSALWEIFNSGTRLIRGMSLQGLRDDIKTATWKAKKDFPNGVATVEFSMFHPADKPAEAKWANNAFYDGVLSDTDFARDLYSAMILSTDGLVQRLQRAALDAIKGFRAIFSRPTPRSVDDKPAAQLNLVIHEMVSKVLETQIGDKYFLPLSSYRALYRMVRDRLVVKDGENVYSTEQVLSGAVTLGPDAAVVELSRESLETLRGAGPESGHPGFVDGAPLPGGIAEVWTGSYTATQLARLPEIGRRLDNPREIGSALRASGLLSNERSTTYRYKEYTSMSRVFGHRDPKTFERAIQTTVKARRDVATKNRLDDLNMRILRALRDRVAVSRNVNEVTKDALLNDLGGVPSDRRLERVTELSSLSNVYDYMNQNGGRVWTYDRRSDNRSDGKLGNFVMNSGDTENHIAPSVDMVIIDLDQFVGLPSSEAWQNEVDDVLAEAKSLELIVSLTASDPSALTEAESLLLGTNSVYGRMEGNLSWLFAPTNPEMMQQTILARDATFKEGQRQELTNTMVIALDDRGDVVADAEGVIMDERANNNGYGASVTTNIVPSTGYAFYHAPNSPEAGKRIKRVLQKLAEQPEYIARQQLIGDGVSSPSQAEVDALVPEIRRLLQKAAGNLDDRTGLPGVGTELEPGDVIALVHGTTGAVLLTRWGYDPRDVDLEAQGQQAFEGISREGIAATSAVKWVGSKKVPSDFASLNRGEIMAWVDDPQFGMRVQQTLPISIQGAKIIGQSTGKKSRGVVSSDRMPSRPMLGRILPNFYSSGEGWRKKGATRGLITNSREGIFFFGWDANRALANAIGIEGAPFSIEEWAAIEDRSSIVAEVRAFLENHRSNTADRITGGANLAARVMTDHQESMEEARSLVQQNREKRGLIAAQRYASIGDQADVEMQYLAAVLTYLKGDGTRVGQVLGATGFDQPDSVVNKQSYRMPPALTAYIDANVELRRYVQADINARMRNNRYENGAMVEGWWVNEDWTVDTIDDKGRAMRLTLLTERVDPTGEDQSERVETNRMTATDDTASDQQQTVAAAAGLDLGYRVPNKTVANILSKRGFADLAAFSRGQNFKEIDAPIRQLNMLEQDRRRRAGYIAEGYLQPIDRSTEEWQNNDLNVREVESQYNRIADALGLDLGKYRKVIDTMIRVWYRAQHDPQKPGVDLISPYEAKAAAKNILANLTNGQWPTIEGRMPAIHANIVDLIATVGTWTPADVDASAPNKRIAMLESALNATFTSRSLVAPDAQLELDGILLTYEKMLEDGYYFTSAQPEVIARLMDPSTGLFRSSIDPLTTMRLERGNPFDNIEQDADDPRYLTRLSETPASRLPLSTQTEAARRRRADLARGADTGGLAAQTVGETARTGRKFRDEVRYTNRFFQDWHAIRTIIPQLNPFLWIWNPVDVASRLAPEQALALIDGTSTGFLGRGIRRGISALTSGVDRGASGEGKGAAALGMLRDAFGIETPYIDETANALLPDVVERLITDQSWRSHIAQETRNRPNDVMNTRREAALQRAVDGVSRLQDVTHGIPPASQARLYIRGILEWHRMNAPEISAADVLLRLREDPLAFFQDSGREAHNVASNKIANIKAARMTTLGVLTNTYLMPLASSSFAPVNAAANTVAILAKFRNFWFSSAVHLMGFQGLDAAAAIILQGRRGGARARGLQGKIGNKGMTADYITEVSESANLADAFIKSGMSHTGLFMAALALQAVGVTGEDEEDRKRRRIEELQGLGALYNPLDIANDFRNRDTLWLEGLENVPFFGQLSALAQVPTEEGQPERSPVQPHWTLNFFTAPIIGVAEFLQTGDFRDVMRGFESAMGNMPLINTNFMWDAFTQANELYQAATDADAEDPAELASATSMLIKAVGTLERATFELAFINELVTTLDTYKRDPWALPELNEDGTIERDREGVPNRTEATVQEIDPVTGETIDVRQTRSYEEGLLRQFAMNNQTFALFATMVTGFQFDKAGSFMRNDQTASQRTIEKAGLSNDAAEQLFLSVWDPENEQEVLTREGQEALFRSLHAGTVSAKDPAMANIFVSFEQRQALSESLQTKIYLEGVDVLGLSQDKAMSRMWDIWYGPDDNPYVTPLSDVVWNRGNFSGENGIPYNQTTTYRQLNSTWVQGPDGRYWATGITRASLAEFFSPLKTYTGSAVSGIMGNLGLDGLLNSVDDVSVVNTGMRALTRVDDSLQIPDEQDVLDAIKASTDKVIDSIKNLNSDLMGDNGFGGSYSYGRGGGYGGGGGGGGRSYANNSLLPFLNGMRNPYADNIPQIYINNIGVRRASVRRERFSAERGRLNNQQ